MKLIFSKRLQAQAWPTLSTQPIIFYALTGFLVIQLIAPVLSAAHPTYAASPEPHGDENGHRDPESKDHSLLQTELIRPISIEPHLRTLVDLLHSINQAADDGHVGSGSDQMAEIADVWFEIEKANVITNLYFEQLEEDLVNRGLFHSIPTLETTRLAYQAEFNHLQLSYETFQKRMTVRAERHALALSAANFQAVLENSESLWPDHPEPNLVALDANRIEVKRLDPSVELSTKSYEPLSVTASEKTRRIAKSTSDVEITPELIALAASLDNDPIKIYEYVYNHIRFDPYYGGRKGALLTLWERSGNDVDIAALTIALLRASGYQARFVQGEAVFEEEELINWIGDPATFEIAADIFATMGMTVTLTSDNQLVKPHVWVEYNPVAGPPLSLPGDLYLPLVSFQSSGFNSISSNKHIEHIEISSRPFETDLDYRTEQATWIPLDTSFKQYTYHAPFDFSTVTGFDAESWIDEMRPTMLFSDTEKSILSLPTLPDLENPGSDYSIDYVEYKVNEAADAVAAYIQANPDLTNRDLLGGDYIITQTVSAIPALPFQIWAERPVIQFEQLPESLKNKVTIEVYAAEEKPIVSYTTSWAEVANKRITISYEAGSAADQATIDSYGALINTPPVVYIFPGRKKKGVEVGRAQEFYYKIG
ncbi:MAG: transglutaminase-like domain-containing protein, partial [Chloroflexota bacterium]